MTRSSLRCAMRARRHAAGRADGPREVPDRGDRVPALSRGWQQGPARRSRSTPRAVDRAMCDAQHIGSIDGMAPERAYQDIRRAWRASCGVAMVVVAGCPAVARLAVSSFIILVHRADGGTHDASNLALVCSACHLAHHRGALTITGDGGAARGPSTRASYFGARGPRSAVQRGFDRRGGSAVASGSAQMDAWTRRWQRLGAHVCAVNGGTSAETGAGGAAAVTVADAGMVADTSVNDCAWRPS